MANESGFKAGTQKKQLKETVTLQAVVKNAVFGDALRYLHVAVNSLSPKVEETSTTMRVMGMATEIPFVHHRTEEGADIPYGSYIVPGLGKVSPYVGDNIVPELTLTVTLEKGEGPKDLWETLIKKVRDLVVAGDSIFIGKAIKIRRPIDFVVPNYFKIDRDIPLFLNEEVAFDVEANIFYPIQHSKKLKDLGIGGRRAALLHGNYGTGKSLIAYLSAQISVENKRSFILCDPSMVFSAVTIGPFLQPATVFVEDLDTIYDSGHHSLARLRNQLSSVEDKNGQDIFYVLTTNLLKVIEDTDRSLLRPDRIDAIIEVTPPRAPIVKRIVEHYAGEFLAPGDDWEGLYRDMASKGCTPSIIVEISKRSRIIAMMQGGAVTVPTMSEQLKKMQRQIELSEPKRPAPETASTRLAGSIRDIAYLGHVVDGASDSED